MKRATKQAIAAILAIIMICMLLPAYGEKPAWDCPECGKTGNTGKYCGGCGYPAPYREGTEKTENTVTPEQEVTYQAQKETNFSVIRVTATIQNGRITDCRIVSKEKSEGSDFLTDEICMAWEKSIIKNQTADTDAITGATLQLSSAAVREAVKDILAQANSADDNQKTSESNDLAERLADAEARIAELTKQLEEATAANKSNGNTGNHLAVGDFITFGHYEQDNDTTNGKEEIEWTVLDVNENEHKALLLSKYGLDAKSYNSSYSEVTWETCTLRTWLNNEFFNESFSQTEQKAILMTAVDNSKSQGYRGRRTNGGNNTQDKIFLLSYAEANQYLGVKYGDWRAAATAYAKQRGAYTSSSSHTADGDPAGWWWLRSPGNIQNNAAGVNYDGSLRNDRVSIDSGCVRPALWVNLESGIF